MKVIDFHEKNGFQLISSEGLGPLGILLKNDIEASVGDS
jgi:hypothetical protein